MTKDEITRPEPGSLPAHISFIEQTEASSNRPMGRPATTSGSKTCPKMPEGSRNESTSPFFSMRPRKRPSGPQSTTATAGPRSFGSRSRPAEVPISRRPASRCQSHNRLGLRGLGLSLDNSAGTIYLQLVAMWTGEEVQEKVQRGMGAGGFGRPPSCWPATSGSTSTRRRRRRSSPDAGRREQCGASWPSLKIPTGRRGCANASGRFWGGGPAAATGTGPRGTGR